MKRPNKVMALLCALLLITACACACGTSEREYNEDIVYELDDGSSIIIKEWSYLLGSGAEIYFKKGNEKPVLIGNTTGGDDGFRPFEAGLFEITQDENALHISWCFAPSDNDKSKWRSKTFELPK